MNTFKPIFYKKSQVAFMVQVAVHFDPGFAGRIGEPSARVNLVAVGVAAPTAKIAQAFGLQKTGRRFVWNPR
jgi:hypothetical protein